MASIVGTLARFARSPQGRRMLDEGARRASQLSKDPATRARIEKVRTSLGRRR